MFLGVIRVGNRCQNTTIQRFSLLNARRYVRENRSIPSSIYHKKHAIFDKKIEAEEALKAHQQKVEVLRTNIVPLSLFLGDYVIDDRHVTSLLAPYSDRIPDSALLDWLGLGLDREQIPDELIDLLNVEASVENMNIKDNEETKPTTDQGEKIDDKQQKGEEKTEDKQEEGEEEKTEDKPKENDDPEMNEEEEEELRRRDELDMEEEYFIKSAVQKPTTMESNSMNEQASSKAKDDEGGDDGQGKWQTVRKRPYDRRRLIRYIIENPTTLDDKTIKQVNNDVWQLSMAQRHDLYRYWLFKYQNYLHFSVRDIRQDYNNAAAALAEYHQEEDYYILKDSVIVAMTTTCAAKYHTVIEKLRKRSNFYDLKMNQRICIYF